MVLSYKELTSPAVEPVTLDEAKTQIPVDSTFTDDDNLITGLIIAARQHCEKIMQRAIYPRSIVLSLDHFPVPVFDRTLNPADRSAFYTGDYIWQQLAIRLPMPSTVSVDSITYRDQSGNIITVDPTTYQADFIGEPCRVVPKWTCNWPTAAYFTPGSVQVTYTAGTWTPDGASASPPVPDVPQALKQAMLLLVAFWYLNREAASAYRTNQIDFAVDALLSPYCFDTFHWTK